MIEMFGVVVFVDEIFVIDGVDGIFIGFNDLIMDMGILGQYDDFIYQEYVIKIVFVGKKVGKFIGIGGIGLRIDLLEKWFVMGVSWLFSG